MSISPPRVRTTVRRWIPFCIDELHDRLPAGPADEREELLNSCIAKAIETYRRRYLSRSEFLALMSRIFRNGMIDRHRRRVASEAMRHRIWHILRPATTDTLDVASIREVVRAVREAIRNLPMPQARVIRYRLKGLSLREISELESCPIQTIATRQRLAMHRLKALLSAFDPRET